LDLITQDAHPGFADAVSGRTDARVRRRLQPTPFPFSGDDSQPPLRVLRTKISEAQLQLAVPVVAIEAKCDIENSA
jgi:hypothetical protein